jgi:hypothetical protein
MTAGLMENCKLKNARISGSTLNGARMSRCVLEGAIMSSVTADDANFNNAQMTLIRSGKVFYVPMCAGDNWIIFDKETKELHYISEPCTVTKIHKLTEEEKENIPFSYSDLIKLD